MFSGFKDLCADAKCDLPHFPYNVRRQDEESYYRSQRLLNLQCLFIISLRLNTKEQTVITRTVPAILFATLPGETLVFPPLPGVGTFGCVLLLSPDCFLGLLDLLASQVNCFSGSTGRARKRNQDCCA